MDDRTSVGAAAAQRHITPGTTFLLALACGCLVANVYYAQPLVGLIGPALGLRPELYSLVVALTQTGYVIGLLFLVPLGDMLETRGLIVATVAAAAVAMLLAALAPGAATFLVASLVIGIFATGTQMLVPLAAHLSDESRRGQTVGNVMSGLLLGILLSRPLSSLLSEFVGWRGVFGFGAGLALLLAVLLRQRLPARPAVDPPRYGALLASLWHVLRDTPVLRRRMLYQAPLFCAFTLFWTVVPLELAGPAFGFSQTGIALFALAGASGALVAPLAGRAADRDYTLTGTGFALGGAVLAWGFALLGGKGSLPLLVVGAVLLDGAVQFSQVLGQRAIYSLAPGIRSRLNGLYVAGLFVGGIVGSAIASVVYVRGGWPAVSAVGAVCGLVPLCVWATEVQGPAGKSSDRSNP